MKRAYLILMLLVAACTKPDYTALVNVFAGTDGAGHCHPCAALPFGALQPGPQTGNYGWDYCGGYQWRDSVMQGFSQNRINGTGSSELGDLLMMPFTGEAERRHYLSRFDKVTEVATPGYYSCDLTDFGIKAEMTCTPHVAIHRYTPSNGEPVKLLLDLQSAQTGSLKQMYNRVVDYDVDYSDPMAVRGYTHSKAWNDRIIYYEIAFNRPYKVVSLLPLRDTAEDYSRTVLDFGQSTEPLMVKASISVTNVKKAHANIVAEIPGWNFEKVRRAAKKAWNEHLGRIDVKGTKEQKRIFYTAMYHLMMHPNNIADVGEKPFYSTLSLWDTFRAAHPLFTIIVPEIVADVVNSFLRYYDAQGFLPIWTLCGTDNYGMIGNHSVPVIVDAWQKGFDVDAEALYAAIKRSLTENHIKYDWAAYDSCGYLPNDVALVESVSRTLECGFDDWCSARMAKGLGYDDDAAFFEKRAGYWRNVFDPETHLMRARNSKGEWETPFDPLHVAHWKTGGAYTEGNAWQYTWHVLQDPEGLMEAMGGREAFVANLDTLFTLDGDLGDGEKVDVSGLIGQYAHGNEPSHHIIYLYSLAGESDKAADLIREVWTSQYKDGPDGLSGNDDCGQMSAWYIFSALGFYPVNPASGEYVIGAPQLKQMKIHLPGGKTFTVKAKDISDTNHRVASVTLNGKPLEKPVISHEDIMAGGTLEFTMRQ